MARAPDLGLERPNQPQPGDPHGVRPISVSRSKRERPRALGALGASRPHEQDAPLPPLGLQRPSCRAAILFPESVSATGPGEGGDTWRWVGKAFEMCTLSSFPLPRPARRAAADTAVPRPDRKRPQGCLGTAREPAGGSPQLSQGLPRAWRPAARAAACLRLETARVSARAEFQPRENRVLLHACTGRFYVTWAGKQIVISQVFIYRGSCIRSDHNLCFSVT